MIVKLTATMRTILVFLAISLWAQAHDIITTSITFNKEIIRIFQVRCTGCHASGARAFPLTTYQDARPWAQAIKEEILARRMPPWGAVKGFGEFRNDHALSNEQVETILGWIDGGVPEGEEKDLPATPAPAPVWAPAAKPTIIVTERGYVLLRAMKLDGVQPMAVPDGASMKVTAVMPDGTVEPLVWIDHYLPKFAHPLFFEEPLSLPAGTRIDGVAAGAKIGLLPKR